MNLLLAQFAVENGDVDANLASIFNFVDQASASGAALEVLHFQEQKESL